MKSKQSKIWIIKNKTKKGIELNDVEMGWVADYNIDLSKIKKEIPLTLATTPKQRYTTKEKIKYAIEANKENLKWMQKFYDWDDVSIPIGKRKVAYVRYLTIVHKCRLETAKQRANKKFGF